MNQPAINSCDTRSGQSPFCRRVYAALGSVPRGRVTTYGALAKAIGCGSPRAVGRALRDNPFAPHVPCHRVIAADGTPGGYKGTRHGAAWNEKLALLASEGVHFRDGRLMDRRLLYPPPDPPAPFCDRDSDKLLRETS